MSCVKLLPNVWDGFKSQFADFPLEVQNCLLDHIDIKVRSAAQKTLINMIWTWQFCDVIYTAPLMLHVDYSTSDSIITGINGCVYTMDAPQSFDTGEPQE